jgi:hypothetical protein
MNHMERLAEGRIVARYTLPQTVPYQIAKLTSESFAQQSGTAYAGGICS